MMFLRNYIFLLLVIIGSAVQGQSLLKIGLLIEHHEEITKYRSAVSEILQKHSLENQLDIIVQSVDGPWGQTSNRVVDLVFEDKVQAIIGILGGRNAHLVEQVTAKSRIPYLELYSIDPSLSAANLPYFFRFNYSSSQLANAAIEHINDSETMYLYVGNNTYDSEKLYSSIKELVETSNLKQWPETYAGYDQVVMIGFDHKCYDAVPESVKNSIESKFILNSTTLKSAHSSQQVNWISPELGEVDLMEVKLDDIIVLLTKAIDQNALSAIELGNKLKTVKKFDGKTGSFSFDSNGNLIRKISFY